MQAPRVAACLRCFDQPLKQSVLTAAEMRVQGIQIDVRTGLKPNEMSATGRRQFLHLLSELGLQIASLDFPTTRAYYHTEQLDARVSAAKRAIDFAFQMKVPIVTARIGRIPLDAESPEYRLLCDVLNDLARYSNRAGATLAFAPRYDDPQLVARLLQHVTEGPFGVNFDPGNFVIGGHDAVEAYRTLYRSVLHVQVRDAIYEPGGSGFEVPVGRGDVKWDELFALFDEARYRGWLTIERSSGDDRIGDMGRAVEYVRRVAEET